MRRVVAVLGRAWSWLQLARYRRRQQKLVLDEQRYEDREAMHAAGIFERPTGF